MSPSLSLSLSLSPSVRFSFRCAVAMATLALVLQMEAHSEKNRDGFHAYPIIAGEVIDCSIIGTKRRREIQINKILTVGPRLVGVVFCVSCNVIDWALCKFTSSTMNNTHSTSSSSSCFIIYIWLFTAFAHVLREARATLHTAMHLNYTLFFRSLHSPLPRFIFARSHCPPRQNE